MDSIELGEGKKEQCDGDYSPFHCTRLASWLKTTSKDCCEMRLIERSIFHNFHTSPSFAIFVSILLLILLFSVSERIRHIKFFLWKIEQWNRKKRWINGSIYDDGVVVRSIQSASLLLFEHVVCVRITNLRIGQTAHIYMYQTQKLTSTHQMTLETW